MTEILLADTESAPTDICVTRWRFERGPMPVAIPQAEAPCAQRSESREVVPGPIALFDVIG